MTTEPNYTDAQIQSHIGMLDANQQIGAVGMIRTARDMLRSLLTERQAAMQGQGGEVRVIVDWRKGNDPRFVEVEGLDGKSVSIPWDQSYPGNGLWSMKLYKTALQPPQPVRSVSDEQWGLIRKTLMYINAAHILGSDVSPKAVNEWRKWLTAALPENQQHAAIAQEKQS